MIKDDMQEVIEKLRWADITIWSFPLYYFSVPGKLKTLIDRQLPMVLPFMEKDAKSGSHLARYDMSNKRSILISTCGFYTTEGNYDAVISMFDHLLGKGNYEKIETPFTVWSDIACGKISGEEAMMKQMYKVKGDFDLMIHWNHYFGDTTNEVENDKEVKENSKTNMMILLLPWVVLWVATSINGYVGTLYVLTSIMTFIVMKTSFSAYVGIINNILPGFMGIFTVWFQKWYPAKIARG